MSDLRIISVRQPWAYLLVSGIKPIENRTWNTSYRGPLLIHAGKAWDKESIESIESRMKFHIPKHPTGFHIPRDLPRGGIVGMANMTDVVVRSDNPFFIGPWTTNAKGEHVRNYGFVLEDAKALPFVPCPGKLNITEPDAHLMRELRAHPDWAPVIAGHRDNQANLVFAY